MRSKNDFQALKVGSRKFSSRHFIYYYKKNENEVSRLGIGVSKKCGKANSRNYIKRIVREFFRNSHFKMIGLDILVVKKNSSEQVFFQDLYRDLEFAFSKINKLNSGTWVLPVVDS